jgi:hypothetical protein
MLGILVASAASMDRVALDKSSVRLDQMHRMNVVFAHQEATVCQEYSVCLAKSEHSRMPRAKWLASRALQALAQSIREAS